MNKEKRTFIPRHPPMRELSPPFLGEIVPRPPQRASPRLLCLQVRAMAHEPWEDPAPEGCRPWFDGGAMPVWALALACRPFFSQQGP